MGPGQTSSCFSALLCIACSHDLAPDKLLIAPPSTSYISFLLSPCLTPAVGAEAHALTCAWTVKEITPPPLASLFWCDVPSLNSCTVLVADIATTTTS